MVTLSNTQDADDGETIARRTVTFINIAHGLDHYVLLIYPTAVIALAAELKLDYGALIALATGAFVAFGVLSLPVGFIANRIGRRRMLAIFFFGTAFSCVGLGLSSTPTFLAVWLLVLGSFASIYHPVGAAMLVPNAPEGRLGRTLGVNGVWGNLGAASAPIVTAGLAYVFGWRTAFFVPALAAAAAGFAFLLLVPSEGSNQTVRKVTKTLDFPHDRFWIIAIAFAVLVAAGGATFNVLSVALPKIIDERLGLALPLWLVGSMATIVFVFGAFSQLNMGRLIERYPLPILLALLAVLQPAGFLLATFTTGVPLVLGLLLAVAAIFGNVVIVDAMVGRYVPDAYRSRVYGLRYFLGFAASGFAVPMIAWLHEAGGFPLVLGVTSVFALSLFASAVVIWRYMSPKKKLALS